METQVKSIFSKDLVTVRASDTLHEAERLMSNYSIRHLPVVDANDTLVGILSKSDFIALKHMDYGLKNLTVRTMMSSPVKTFPSSAKVRAVAQLFINKKISCALVAEGGEIVGIVTSEDLIKMLANKEELSAEAERIDLAELAEAGWISRTAMI